MKSFRKIALSLGIVALLFSNMAFVARADDPIEQGPISPLDVPFGGDVVSFVPPHLLCDTGFWLIRNYAGVSFSGLIGIIPIGPPILGSGIPHPGGSVIGFYSKIPTTCVGSVLVPVWTYVIMGAS
ncbi:MAG TPA: hypothetical protein VHQ20_02970 [Patescibacteria group bacterium]|nr:hypothetical protein [Patescibacteria group bacterium]